MLQIIGPPDEVHKAQRSIEDLLRLGGAPKTPAIYYLPKAVNGLSVLQKLGERHFRAVNAELQGRTQGVNYRASKNADDKLLIVLKWGCEVIATDEGDGWIAVEDEIIPGEELDPLSLQMPLDSVAWDRAPLKEPIDRDIPDYIQFASNCFYCREGSPSVSIEVVRAGPCANRATVDYHTEDGSAKARQKYVPATGTLTFAPGVTRASLNVNLLENDSFDTTLDFHVLLNNANGATIGRHLHNCQIIIIDNDTFPSNKYRELLESGRVHEIDHWALVAEYVFMVLRNSGFRSRVFQSMFCDQLVNFTYIYNVYLFNYMIDEVLQPCCGNSPPADARLRIAVIGALETAPWFVIWLTSLYKVSLKIQGIANSQLQSNLFRTALRYSDQSWEFVPLSDLVMSITRDVPQVVDQIFPHLLGFFEKFGRLLILSATIFWQTRNHGLPDKLVELSLLLGFTLALAIFLRIRESGTTRRRDEEFRAQTENVALVQQVGTSYQLIQDYSQQPSVVTMFMTKVNRCCDAKRRVAFWEVTNTLFAPFLGTVVVGIYCYHAAGFVLDGGPLGEFVSGTAMWMMIGQCFQGMYEEFLGMTEGIAPLQNVSFYMNLKLRSLDDMTASEYALTTGRKLMDKAQKEHVKGHYSWNDVPLIETSGITFRYKTHGGGLTILDEASFSLPQGKMIGVTGSRGVGKATLLKLLGGVLLPDEGQLFVPPHLRVLHVGLPPQLMGELNIFENICFGPSDGDDEKPARVMKIIQRLGLTDSASHITEAVERQGSMASLLEESRVSATKSSLHHHYHQKAKVRSCLSTQSKSFGTGFSAVMRTQQELEKKLKTSFSQSQLMSISIARALVMNPDLMVIHNPWSTLDEQTGPLVTKLLREFVDLRGVENPAELQHERKLRSCIFTTNKHRREIEADMLLTLAGKKVICEDISKKRNVTEVVPTIAPTGIAPTEQGRLSDVGKEAPRYARHWKWAQEVDKLYPKQLQ